MGRKKASSGQRSNYRPKVPDYIRLELYHEAGNKCANPGCANALIELHHIKEWHVYQTHDQEEMIAVCPTCHRHAHYGQLKIDDATIRRWKCITRTATNRGHIYVEPGDSCRMLLGSIYMTNGPTNPEGLIVFNLSQKNQLRFRIAGDDIMLVNLRITDTSGRELIRVVDGHIKHAATEPLLYESRPGKCHLTAPATSDYLPAWVLDKYNEQPPVSMVDDGRFTVLDLEVLDRGTVQVQGVWAENDRAVVITEDWLSICLPEKGGFAHLRGYGEVRGEPKNLNKLPTFQYDGPIGYSILGEVMNRSGL